MDNFFELSEGVRVAEATTPKWKSKGPNTTDSVGEGLGVHIALWERSLRTVLAASSLPAAPDALRREHIEASLRRFRTGATAA